MLGPFPPGRNQESTSESVAAYEAIALYGDSAANMFSGDSEKGLREAALHIKDIGEILLATEIRSAEMYWHVRNVSTKTYPRIYPQKYEHRVIGRLWSSKAEMSTFFGPEHWKSYGIQLIPVTPIAEQRDESGWLAEMAPYFTAACLDNVFCHGSGWAVLMHILQGSLCNWKAAAAGIQALREDVFYDYGGNGHSRSNSLWWIATRPCD